MSRLVLKLDRTIQTIGNRNTTPMSRNAPPHEDAGHELAVAAPTSGPLGGRGTVTHRPPLARSAATWRRAWSRAYTMPTPTTIAVSSTAIAEP